jgi:hypothetical protein
MKKQIRLIRESDSDLILDRAKVILASTTINADIKRMIDKLGKLSTGTVMGISSTTSTAFGAEVASNFVKNITTQLNNCMAQLQTSTEAIDAELKILDNITKGVTDLQQDVGVTDSTTPPIEDDSTPDTEDTQDNTDNNDDVTDSDLDDMFGADPALLKPKVQTPKTTVESANNILAGAMRRIL